jgi:hypothetical protein
MQRLLVRLRVRWLAWRYRQISAQRRRLREKIMHITEAQARIWYEGELARCRKKTKESR